MSSKILTRRQRAERSRSRLSRRVIAAGVAIVLIVTLVGATALWAFSERDGVAFARKIELSGLAASPLGARSEAITGEATAIEASATASVEIPDLVGKTVAEARSLLAALGLAVDVRGGLVDGDVVGVQEPDARSVVPPGATVTIAAADGETSARPSRALADSDEAAGLSTAAAAVTAAGGFDGSAYVVVIDPGHQSRGDSTHEPVGPGASETKPRVTGGTSGVVTGVPEYEIVLQISVNLKNRLERAGVRVIMTRTTNDVSISNAERASMANEVGADLFVRIHADGSTNPDIAGISTLYPGENRWTGPIAPTSMRAADCVHQATVAATGATSRGTIARTDLSGFNWSRVPSVLVECGFMSNAVEDRLLSSPHYQDKLADGMAAGIIAFLDSSR